MNYDDAFSKAEEIRKAIEPFCLPDRCAIAGSIRRKKPVDIKDIEIVALPDLTDSKKFDGLRKAINGNLFGSVDIGAFPSKYTRVVGSVCNIDFFWQSKASWGLNLFIRTGPADFAMRALAHFKKITNGGYSLNANLYLSDGTLVPTPHEEDVFAALKCKWIPPERRK